MDRGCKPGRAFSVFIPLFTVILFYRNSRTARSIIRHATPSHPFTLFIPALLYNVANMYKNSTSMPRIITLLCLHLSQRLRAPLSTQEAFIGLTLSSFWSPSSTLSLAPYIANRTGTHGPLLRLARNALRRQRGIFKYSIIYRMLTVGIAKIQWRTALIVPTSHQGIVAPKRKWNASCRLYI